MYNFNYHRPRNATEALAAVIDGEDTQFLAGGMTLIPTMKQRLARPSDLVDLAELSELKGVREAEGTVVIGAMTTHAEVSDAELIRQNCPALAALAGNIGDPQVRSRGTLGGSIANNDPAADYPAACIALKAVIITNKREIDADDFFTGLFSTALEHGELITAVRFPPTDLAAYQKFPNPASRYAIVGVFVAKTNGDTRVSVTGAGQDGVFRLYDLERSLLSDWDADAADTVRIAKDELNSDIHAGSEYRAHLIKVMARRAIVAAGRHNT